MLITQASVSVAKHVGSWCYGAWVRSSCRKGCYYSWLKIWGNDGQTKWLVFVSIKQFSFAGWSFLVLYLCITGRRTSWRNFRLVGMRIPLTSVAQSRTSKMSKRKESPSFTDGFSMIFRFKKNRSQTDGLNYSNQSLVLCLAMKL